MELFPCTGNLKFTANQKDNVVPRCKLRHLNDVMSRDGAGEDELEVWTMVDCDAGKWRRIDRLVRLEARGCVSDLYTHQVVFVTSIWEALWFDLKNRKITRMPVDHQFAGGFKLESDLIPICHACTMKCQEPMIHKDGKLKRMTSDGEQDFDNRSEDYYYKGSRMTSHEGRHQLDKVTAGRFSGDDSPRIHKKHPDNKHYSSSHRKPTIQSNEELSYAERGHERGSHQSVYGRDQLSHPSEKSNAEADDLSAGSNWQDSDRKRHHHGIFLKKQSERRGHHASEFSPKSQHRTRTGISDGGKVAPDHKKQSLVLKEASHSFRPSRQIPKSKDNRLEYERW